MLDQAIGDFLPAAAAVALSPIPIIAVVLVLGTPRARTTGPTFALGWVTGLAVVSVVIVMLAGNASDPDSDTATGVNWMQVGIGLLFLVMAAKQWRKRPKSGEEPEMPAWVASLDSLTPGRGFLLGAALSGANPKNLALTASAAASIAQADLDSTDTAIAIAVFVVLGSSTVAGAVIFYLLDADRAAGPLDTIKEFVSDHSTVIMMVILILLGAKILGDGLGRI